MRADPVRRGRTLSILEDWIRQENGSFWRDGDWRGGGVGAEAAGILGCEKYCANPAV